MLNAAKLAIGSGVENEASIDLQIVKNLHFVHRLFVLAGFK